MKKSKFKKKIQNIYKKVCELTITKVITSFRSTFSNKLSIFSNMFSFQMLDFGNYFLVLKIDLSSPRSSRLTLGAVLFSKCRSLSEHEQEDERKLMGDVIYCRIK